MEDMRLQSGRAVKWDESGKACPERGGVEVSAESYQALVEGIGDHHGKTACTKPRTTESGQIH